MSGATDILIKKLADTINSSPAKKVSPYDTQAEVRRVEGDIAWVHIPGGVDETPVQLTTNAKKGDIVQVRVSGGRAWLYGNQSSPPTDDTKANKVEKDLLKTEVEVYETITITETKIYNQIEAARAHIDELIAEKADITDLNAATARIGALETDNTNIKGRLTAAEADIDTLDAEKATITDLNAATARIGTLETDNTNIKGRLTAAEADIDTLDANKATITDLNAATARIGTLEADHVSVSDFEAEQANIDNLQAATADIDTIRANSAKVQNLTAAQLEADHATVGSLDTNYAQINLANVNNSWITNGVIKNAAIGDAQISGVSANKLTAGTIDASNITVTNLNADNITTGTINGQRIGAGSLSLDKLSEDVYTETEVDNKLRDIQLEIDGAIETYTGTVVPTLNNTPASSWTTTDLKDKHVGDIYYVVNNDSQQNGYCYRFTKSGNVYSWVLIKDSDVTAALQRLTEAEGDISGLQQFETTTSSWISNTDTELNSLKSRTTNVETSLGDKVDSSTFNELSQTVDENSASITSLSTTVQQKADNSTVTTLSNTVNSVQQTANSNSSKISSLTTTLGTNADGTTKAGDIMHRTSAVEQDLSGFKTTVSNTYATKTALNDKADADDLDALTSRVSTAETTITQQAGQISLKANSSDVYTKTATNNLLADKADADDVYTKDDIDDEFALYTKTADFSVAPGQIQSTITNAVADKANSSDVYTKTQIDQTVNGINTTVSSKVGNDEVISRINQSSESITIDANRVNIAGAAIFDNYSLKSQTVSNVVVEYAKSNSATSQPTSGWSTNTPTWEAGKYIWQRTGKTINGTTTYTYTCIQGAKGETGAQGPQGVTGAQGPQGETGAQGPQGETGASGTSITITNIRYAVSTTESQPADSSFTYTSVPTVAEGSWLWTKTLYSDGSKVYTKAKQGKQGPTGATGATGATGEQGPQGETGATGTSVTVSSIKYAVSTTESQPADSSFTYTSVPTVAEGSWLWTLTTFSNGSKAYSKAKQGAQGPQGQTGASGTSVTVSSIKYAVSTTESQPADSSFTYTSVPTVAEGSWLWTLTTFSNGSKVYSKAKQGKGGMNGTTFTPSVDANGNISWTNDGGKTNPTSQNIKGPTGATGATGATGQTGPQGVSITNVTSTNNTQDGGTSVITVTLSNGTTKTFNVKNGNKGTNGASSQWYYGTACTHTSGTATPATGISSAIVGDMYLNNNTYSVYRCTTAGASGTAVWTYAGNLVDGVIDDVQIGGTNLLILSEIGDITAEPFKNSSVYDPSISLDNVPQYGVSGVYHFQVDISSLEIGQKYTLSFDAVRYNASAYPIFLGVNDDNHINLGNLNSTRDWKRFSYTFTYSSDIEYFGIRCARSKAQDSTSSGTGSYYCGFRHFKLEKGNIATEWSPAPEDALGSSQRIYKRTNSSTAPAAPTSIVTATTDQGVTGNWTLMHMPRVASSNTAYKYLWTCEQQISLGGYFLGTTAVVADNGTTVIDGGDIQTGTVSADRLNVNDIITKGSIVVSGDNISKLNNNSGYQTSSQVDTAITSKGYQTSSQVETAITSKGYQTASQVDTAITSKGYQTSSQVSTAINNRENTLASQFGYRYTKNIVIYGDSDKYYPVYFTNTGTGSISQNVSYDMTVYRSYSEQAPSDWNTSTHKGGLTLHIRWNFGGWGGITYKAEILELTEMYSSIFGDLIPGKDSGMFSTIWLRGGGTTGALYHLYSEIPFNLHTYMTYAGIEDSPYIGLTQGTRYAQSASGSDPQYHWEVAAPLTAPNISHYIQYMSITEEQYIYISKVSGTTSVPENTTWVSVSSDSQNTWTTKRPTYSSSYPVLFVAKQKKTVSGIIICTTPVKDDTTTIIDGGHITTGTIDSNRLNANTIHVNAANIDGTLNASQINTSGITISQSQVTNLTTDLASKADSDDIPTNVSQLTNDSNFATESYADGKASAAQTAAISTASTDATNKANSAAWTVSIEVSSINYSTPTATLVAKPYYYGTLTTSGITYQWSKNGTNISGATSNSYTATDFNASYTCTIS